MKKFDFLTKTLIDSFSFTTITKNREAFSDVLIDGRKYTKYGTLQGITIVGNLYEDFRGNRILMCGISKQHPYDTKCNKQTSYEVAQAHALFNPDIIINTVPEYIDKYIFGQMMSWYVDAMKVDFIKTRQEIINAGHDPKKYNR